MNIKLQIIIAVGVVIALVAIINMIRKKNLELRYALAWLGVGVGILILDLCPGLVSWISVQLGIVSPVNTLFFLGFCFSLVIIFVLTVAISRLSVRVKELSQELALNKKDDTEVK